MSLSPKQYGKMSKKASPPTKSWRNIPRAFIIGGLICILGQAINHFYLYKGLEREDAYGATSITLIFLSIFLTGVRIYDKIALYAGAGTLVPITGFANAMSSAAIEFKSEGLILGLGAKLFIIAGPVIVYGLSASVIYGLVIWILGG